MVVAGFRRSLSFTGSPGRKTRPATEKSYHVRSTSLPCRSHPLITQLEDAIRSVRAWHSEPKPASPSWLSAGLARLDLLAAALDDLLHLPQSQDALRRGSAPDYRSAPGWTDRVLDHFLRFADVHGSFRSAIVALDQHQSAARIAIRSRDVAKLASCVRFQRKIEKELIKLASSIREVLRSPIAPRLGSDIGETELVGIIREVIEVTVTASAAIFLGIAAASAASAAEGKGSGWRVMTLRRISSLKRKAAETEEEEGESSRREAMERLERLKECIGAVESGSDRLFRCLVNTRVSLLNILTP